MKNGYQIIEQNGHYMLADQSGNIVPGQISITIEDRANDALRATVELIVSRPTQTSTRRMIDPKE